MAEQRATYTVEPETASTDGTGTALAAPGTALPMPVAGPDELIAAMAAFERARRAVINRATDFQRARDGREFPKKPYFVKLGIMFQVSTLPKTVEEVRDENGDLQRVRVTVRAELPNGRFVEAIGTCSIREPRFTDAKGKPIWSARQKLDHDLVATAETRATNRAIDRLLGWEPMVSWEEVEPDYTAAEREAPTEARPAQARLVSGQNGGDPKGPATPEQYERLDALGRKLDRQAPKDLTRAAAAQLLGEWANDLNQQMKGRGEGAPAARERAATREETDALDGELRILAEMRGQGESVSAVKIVARRALDITRTGDQMPASEASQLLRWVKTQCELIAVNRQPEAVVDGEVAAETSAPAPAETPETPEPETSEPFDDWPFGFES